MNIQAVDPDSATTLTFSVEDTTRFGEIDSQGQHQRLQMVLQLIKPTSLVTKQNRSLMQVRWKIMVHSLEKYNEHAKEIGAIGFLQYNPHRLGQFPSEREFPEECSIGVAAGASAFETLASAAMHGRKPTSLSVSVCGLAIGPDRLAVWDTGSGAILPVLGVAYELPLAK